MNEPVIRIVRTAAHEEQEAADFAAYVARLEAQRKAEPILAQRWHDWD